MTLIIGCITEDVGVICGDTQLSIGDLKRGTKLRRETQVKIHRPSSNLVYGIMGKWSHYIPVPGEPGMVSIINHYDLMRRGVNREENKRQYLNAFISGKTDIDATILLIEKDDANVFSLDEISSLPDRDLSQLKIDNISFRFNEPFSSVNPNYVEGLIGSFFKSNELTSSSLDILFLMNNIQLTVISNGFSFNITDEKDITHVISSNSVGGVVNLSIITNHNNSWNDLSKPYNSDANTLLDKTTYPFSRYVDNYKVIRYVDNLSMLVRNIFDPFNNNISDTLIELVIKQINYIVNVEIISKSLMNALIFHINARYTLEIPLFDIEVFEATINEDEINLENIIFDDNVKEVDLGYLLRFF